MASSIIDSIKETVLGVKSNETDRIIDKSLEKISLYSSNNDNNKYIEALKNIVSSSTTGNGSSVLGQLDRGMPQVQTYDQSGRVARYAEYDSVCNKISYAQRALQVLVDHIIAPDDILKYSLQIVPFDRDIEDKKVEIAKTRLREIFKHFKFEKKVKELVSDTLKYGDKFVEIVPVPKGKNALVVINEGIDYNVFRTPTQITEFSNNLEFVEEQFNYDTQKYEQVKSNKEFKIIVDECKIEEYDEKTNKIILNEEIMTSVGLGGTLSGLGINMMTPLSALPQSSSAMPKAMSKDPHIAKPTDPEDKKFKSKYSEEIPEEDEAIEDGERLPLRDINLVYHNPKYVIRLETERFKVCLGYLVFPKVDPATMLGNGINTNIDAICSNFLDDIQKKLNIKDNDKIAVNDDIRKVLLSHLMRIKKNDDLKIRYVAPQYMEHFRINVSRYAPYGESLFDSSLYDCKLLMALKTAATIKKINASSDKRFVSVEVGLPRDAKNVVQKMEEFLTKKRISIGSMGNIDSIPSQISTFETIFIPMKDNKKFVEIDHQNWGGDTSNDTDNIKNMRDNIVGNWGVPAPFLNIEENCLPYDTQIRLLDGDSLPIGRIVDLWESNEKNRNVWVYSCDPQTGKIKPGKVTNVFRTRKNAQLVRVHLDNGTYVDATPDHKFMLRNGSYIEAQYLKSNDSLMPVQENYIINVNSVEWLTERKDCYDIEVDNYHNFGLTNGIIVHNSSNRSSLTTESINFVRIIISYQKELSDPLHELASKIYTLIYGRNEADILDKIQVTFAEPKALPNSAQAEYIETMQRVIDALAALGISKEYLKKEYLPNIDWDKAEKTSTLEKLQAETGESSNNMDMMMGGVGMAPSMGGMPGGF